MTRVTAVTPPPPASTVALSIIPSLPSFVVDTYAPPSDMPPGCQQGENPARDTHIYFSCPLAPIPLSPTCSLPLLDTSMAKAAANMAWAAIETNAAITRAGKSFKDALLTLGHPTLQKPMPLGCSASHPPPALRALPLTTSLVSAATSFGAVSVATPATWSVAACP